MCHVHNVYIGNYVAVILFSIFFKVCICTVNLAVADLTTCTVGQISIVLCGRWRHTVIITPPPPPPPLVSDSRCDSARREGGYYFNRVANRSLSLVMCHSAVGSHVDGGGTVPSHCAAM